METQKVVEEEEEECGRKLARDWSSHYNWWVFNIQKPSSVT